MCGIAGFCDFGRDNGTQAWGEVAFRMGETLRRRGPDDRGVWQTGPCALAHRRLAVIDPEHGSQPMVRTLDGKECALCYNGELYNTPELRREVVDTMKEMHSLYRRGHTPKVKPTKSCNACSLKDLCLPRMSRCGSVKSYLQRHMEEIP